MATRAVYSFSGFPGIPERHLYLHHDGYPSGAACRLAAVHREAGDAARFFTTFLSTQHQAELLASPDHAADAEYHYRVQHLPGSAPQLVVQCWQRVPDGCRWMILCRPMQLAAFIQRFLASDQL